MMKKIMVTTILFLFLLSFGIIWKQTKAALPEVYWWEVVGLSLFPCLSVIVADFFLWKRFKRYIDIRLDGLNERIDRHDRECPARKELMLKTALPADETNRNSEAFRRSFQSSNPTYILRLRELVPSVTPAEELLCMYIWMRLSNKEVADRMSISQSSLHTVRYRLKRKLPLEEGGNMDDWIRSLE